MTEPTLTTEMAARADAAELWSCGHTALGQCGECYRLLAAKSAALQARLDDTEEALDNVLRAGAHTGSGARDVLIERGRQIRAEGFDATHDDEHENGELIGAAIAYTLHASNHGDEEGDGYADHPPDDAWPGHWDIAWWKPKDPRRDLIRAAALIIAEIDRLDRAAPKSSSEPVPSPRRGEGKGEGSSS